MIVSIHVQHRNNLLETRHQSIKARILFSCFSGAGWHRPRTFVSIICRVKSIHISTVHARPASPIIAPTCRSWRIHRSTSMCLDILQAGREKAVSRHNTYSRLFAYFVERRNTYVPEWGERRMKRTRKFRWWIVPRLDSFELRKAYVAKLVRQKYSSSKSAQL